MKKSDNKESSEQKIKGILLFTFIIGLVICSVMVFIGSLPSFYSKIGWDVGDSIILSFFIGIVITLPLAIIFEKKSR